jgi:hypothetical protein
LGLIFRYIISIVEFENDFMFKKELTVYSNRITFKTFFDYFIEELMRKISSSPFNHLINTKLTQLTEDMASKSTQIKWSVGSDLSKRFQELEKAFDKNEKETDSKNSLKCALDFPKSFFNWFTDLDDSALDIAEDIKDDIWPNPLQYFLKPLNEYEGLDGDEGKDYSDEDESDGSVIVVVEDDYDSDDDEEDIDDEEEDIDVEELFEGQENEDPNAGG